MIPVSIHSNAADVQMSQILQEASRGIKHCSREMVVSKTNEGFNAIEMAMSKYRKKSSHSVLYEALMNTSLSNKEKVAAVQGL